LEIPVSRRGPEEGSRADTWVDRPYGGRHPASTVDSYVTGAKQQLLEQFVISEALGRAGGPRRMLVVNAVRSVAVSTAKRAPYLAEWIREGRSSWPVPVYVAVVTMFMAALR
jgi:uncharacterized iron-regulated membrane protein